MRACLCTPLKAAPARHIKGTLTTHSISSRQTFTVVRPVPDLSAHEGFTAAAHREYAAKKGGDDIGGTVGASLRA